VKAFILSLLALAPITAVSALILQLMPVPSIEVYSEKPNFRL
jgi:hypothetical protein